MDESSAKFLRQEYELLYRLCLRQSKLLRSLGESGSEDETGERLLRLPEVLRRTGLSKRTIGRLEAAGKFPARRQIAERAVGWADSDIRAWMDDPAGWQRTKPS